MFSNEHDEVPDRERERKLRDESVYSSPAYVGLWEGFLGVRITDRALTPNIM